MKLPRSLGWILVALAVLVALGALTIEDRVDHQKRNLAGALAHTAEDEAWLEALPHPTPALKARIRAYQTSKWPQYDGRVVTSCDWYLRGERPPVAVVARHEVERPAMEEVTVTLTA